MAERTFVRLGGVLGGGGGGRGRGGFYSRKITKHFRWLSSRGFDTRAFIRSAPRQVRAERQGGGLDLSLSTGFIYVAENQETAESDG